MSNNRFTHRFKESLNTSVSTHSFALFRILFCLVLLILIKEVIFFRPLLFDDVEGVSYNSFPAKLFLYVWFFSVVMVGIGWRTRIFAIVNYGFTVIATAFFTNSGVSTFNDDLLRIGSFLMIFMPVSRSFSIDAIIENLYRKEPGSRQTSYANYFFFIFLSLGLLYTGSAITKLYADIWSRGLGLWIPINMPYNHWNELHTLFIDQYWFMVFLNWFVIVWELLFIFILFNKKWHWIIVIPGIIFHIGIALLFPFPKICLGPLVFYTLFIPDSFWTWLAIKFESSQKITIGIRDDQPNQLLLKRFLNSIDYRKKFSFTNSTTLTINGAEYTSRQAAIKLFQTYAFLIPLSWILRIEIGYMLMEFIVSELPDKKTLVHGTESVAFITYRFKQNLLTAFVFFMIGMQLISQCYHIYSHYTATPEKIKKYLLLRKSKKDLNLKLSNLARTFLGINSRGLFLDHSNHGQKIVYAITYFDKAGNEVWLPFFDERGFSNGYNMNMDWPRYSFNSVCYGTNPADSVELKKYTLFWAMKTHHALDSINMNVYQRKYVFPLNFEQGYYKKLQNIPWDLEGKILWQDSVFHYTRIYSDSTN